MPNVAVRRSTRRSTLFAIGAWRSVPVASRVASLSQRHRRPPWCVDGPECVRGPREGPAAGVGASQAGYCRGAGGRRAARSGLASDQVRLRLGTERTQWSRANSVTSTIEAASPGDGGCIAAGLGAIWVTIPGAPLTRIDPGTDTVTSRFVGHGGDCLSVGFGSVWLSNHDLGNVWRIAPG